MTYKLKQIPEDFIVEEIINLDINPKGTVTYFKLEKTLHNTLDAVTKVAKALRIRMSKFRFAGNKDKQAVTTQYVSAYQLNPKKLDTLDLHNIKVTFVGKGDTPINLGTNEGNKFTITIRNIESRPKQKKNFLNLYGVQRFGKDNVPGGRALAKKDFKTAAEIIFESPANKRHLKGSLSNPVNALRSIPKKVLLFYLHAYQSQLWNETVLRLLEDKPDIMTKFPLLKIPLIGFGFDDELRKVSDKEIRESIKKITDNIMGRELIKPRDFVFRKFPELSSEGGSRPAFVRVEDLKVFGLEDDELNESMKKVRVKFSLPKGAYATEFIRQLFE